MHTTSTPTISVIVFVFNHEKYIERSLASIESQEIDANIEIIIHDDASTDGSQAIYRNFAQRSRHTVKIIRQPENKYSKRISMWPDIIPACSGDFFALCDGDDFWISTEKLAHQLHGLMLMPNIDLTFHKVARVHYSTEAHTGYYGDYGDEPKLFTAAAVIEGDGGCIPTASLMCRRGVLDTLPAWFFDQPPVEDYYIQVFGALKGGALYLPMCAAAYQEGDPQSWSQRTLANIASANSFELRFIEYLFHLRATLAAEFAANVDKIMLNHYLTLCRQCFTHHAMEDLGKLAKLIEQYR